MKKRNPNAKCGTCPYWRQNPKSTCGNCQAVSWTCIEKLDTEWCGQHPDFWEAEAEAEPDVTDCEPPALLDEIERLRAENALQHSQLLEQAINVLPDRDATIERLREENTRLREDNGQLKDDKDQMEIGNVALMQRVAELKIEVAVLKEKLRTAEDFNENYTVIDDIGPLPKCFRCAHQQSMAFRGPDAPCYQCGIDKGYPKFKADKP